MNKLSTKSKSSCLRKHHEWRGSTKCQSEDVGISQRFPVIWREWVLCTKLHDVLSLVFYVSTWVHLLQVRMCPVKCLLLSNLVISYDRVNLVLSEFEFLCQKKFIIGLLHKTSVVCVHAITNTIGREKILLKNNKIIRLQERYMKPCWNKRKSYILVWCFEFVGIFLQKVMFPAKWSNRSHVHDGFGSNSVGINQVLVFLGSKVCKNLHMSSSSKQQQRYESKNQQGQFPTVEECNCDGCDSHYDSLYHHVQTWTHSLDIANEDNKKKLYGTENPRSTFKRPFWWVCNRGWEGEGGGWSVWVFFCLTCFIIILYVLCDWFLSKIRISKNKSMDFYSEMKGF